MKTLKALLLVFILSFTVNNVNAQENTSLECEHFGMQVYPSSIISDKACFDVTVTSIAPRFLFIIPEGDRHIQSATEVTSLSTVICFDRPSRLSLPLHTYIECRMDNSYGDVLCREGCWVTVHQ